MVRRREENLLAVIGALLAGCTLVSCPEPQAGMAVAEIVFSKGHEGRLGVSGSQYYRISESGRCYLRVTDTATGTIPSSFTVDNDPSCNAAAARA
jgi:hypothetical protein